MDTPEPDWEMQIWRNGNKVCSIPEHAPTRFMKPMSRDVAWLELRSYLDHLRSERMQPGHVELRFTPTYRSRFVIS